MSMSHSGMQGRLTLSWRTDAKRSHTISLNARNARTPPANISNKWNNRSGQGPTQGTLVDLTP